MVKMRMGKGLGLIVLFLCRIEDIGNQPFLEGWIFKMEIWLSARCP
jgi:hypothetical protein